MKDKMKPFPKMKPKMKTDAKNGAGYKRGFAEGGSVGSRLLDAVGKGVSNAADTLMPGRLLDRARNAASNLGREAPTASAPSASNPSRPTRASSAASRSGSAEGSAEASAQEDARTRANADNRRTSQERADIGERGNARPSAPARRAAPARRRSASADPPGSKTADELNEISLRLARGENAGNSREAGNIGREMRGYSKGGAVRKGASCSRSKYMK